MTFKEINEQILKDLITENAGLDTRIRTFLIHLDGALFDIGDAMHAAQNVIDEAKSQLNDEQFSRFLEADIDSHLLFVSLCSAVAWSKTILEKRPKNANLDFLKKQHSQ